MEGAMGGVAGKATEVAVEQGVIWGHRVHLLMPVLDDRRTPITKEEERRMRIIHDHSFVLS